MTEESVVTEHAFMALMHVMHMSEMDQRIATKGRIVDLLASRRGEIVVPVDLALAHRALNPPALARMTVSLLMMDDHLNSRFLMSGTLMWSQVLATWRDGRKGLSDGGMSICGSFSLGVQNLRSS